MTTVSEKLLLQFRSKDTQYGVTRNTLRALSAELDVPETQVVHMALSRFAADVLRRVHADGSEATDDAALVEQAGGCTMVVAGDPLTRKITTPDDLEWLAARISQQHPNGAP